MFMIKWTENQNATHIKIHNFLHWFGTSSQPEKENHRQEMYYKNEYMK